MSDQHNLNVDRRDNQITSAGASLEQMYQPNVAMSIPRQDQRIYTHSVPTELQNASSKYFNQLPQYNHNKLSNCSAESYGFYFDTSSPNIGGRHVISYHNNSTVVPKVMYKDTTAFTDRRFSCQQPLWHGECL